MPEGLARLEEMPDWLAGLDDAARVQTAVAEVVPGLRHAKLSGIRLKPGAWTARCTVDVGDGVLPLAARILPPGQWDRPVPPSQRSAEGWPRWLPELRLELVGPAQPEADLPAVALLTDPERARGLLETAIRDGAPAYRDLHIVTVTPHVMRHSPGSRCTVLYDLELLSEDIGRFPTVVVAKTYHREDKGRVAWDGMREVWASPLRDAGVVTVAEPLAWLPEPKILVQGPIPQQRTLKQVLFDTLASGDPGAMVELRDHLARTAAGLAALHHCGAVSGELVSWQDELDEVRDVLSRLVAAVPSLDGAADAFLTDLVARATRTPPDPALPAHRSFRPAQVLLHDGDIGFIDFDGFCQAEPALDLALFRATARDVGMGAFPAGTPYDARLAVLDELCEHFLASYEAVAPVSRERVALWEALDLLTNVLHSWTKVKPARLARSAALLRHHAAGERMLAI